MRVLCNLPLECFDERSAMPGIELCTYGPADRGHVDGVQFPPDVVFDPATEDWAALQARLPRDFTPDLVLIYWPDQDPLPAGIEHCPVPVVGVVSDYNLSLPYLVGLWPFFDAWLCDRAGVSLFERLSFAGVRYWNQYAHKRPFHRIHPDVARTIDLGFVGNLNPAVQRERAPWLERLRRLPQLGVTTEVHGGIRGAAYGRFLNACKIGWNRSIRGELNLRAFEVPACGALLLLEQGNLEVAEYFVPGEECVLYGDDLEAIVLELLGDPARLQRIARAGHRRVQDHRLGNRLPQLCAALQRLPRQRPASSPFERALGRATAMLPTWASGAAVAAAARDALRLAPDDPRARNLMALALLRWQPAQSGAPAWQLWQDALCRCPEYLPAAANLHALAQRAGDARLLRAAETALARCLPASTWAAIDGPTLPLGYAAAAVDRSLALQDAIRTGSPSAFGAAFAPVRSAYLPAAGDHRQSSIRAARA